MKRILIIISISALLIILGCEKLKIGNAFLEKAPGVDVTIDTVFSDLEHAERVLWGAYRTLRFGITVKSGSNPLESKLGNDQLEDISDLAHSKITYGGAYVLYYTGSYNAASENSNGMTKYHLTFDQGFAGIRKSYIFLQNIDRVPDVDPEYKKQLKAEARMIIAMHYADMYRNYGGMPWINRAYSAADPIADIPRLTARALCDSIVALCDKAAADLPWKIENLEEWDGRFTRASAMGLKARVLLFDASPLFNSATPYLDSEAAQQKLTWHGGYDANLWKRAADAAHNLIAQAESTGDYKLYHKDGNSFRKDFQEAYYQRGISEALISVRYMFRTPTSTGQYQFYQASWGYGCSLPTQNYVEMFPMASGKPIKDLTSGYDSTNPYINRDPRLYETVLTNGDAFQGRTAELYIGGRERLTISQARAGTGYTIRKFMLDHNTATSLGSITHWPYLRLPEIYLSYAEAINEYNNGPDDEAYRCVNIVRKRVGLDDLPAGLTKEEFREKILTERACEFGWEEVRWFDLIRWKKEADFKKRLYGMNIYRSTTTPYKYTYERFLLSPRRYWADNWSAKWYLSAFASNELNKGYGLIQNPGWE